MKKEIKYYRGDLVWVELGQHSGKHVQSGRKLCLIISNNKGNRSVLTVMVGTSNLDKSNFPVHEVLTISDIRGHLAKPTVFMAEQIATVDRQDIIMKVGCIDKDTDALERINSVLRKQLEI